MSLYLPEQKLGSFSQAGSSSHKFMLKGRQTGTMHRGHSWVFRAESHDTMLAWYEDIKKLTEATSGRERNAVVRAHRRTMSDASTKAGSVSSGGFDEDEDEPPYSASASAAAAEVPLASDTLPARPSPGGRFPSDLNVNRGLEASPASSDEIDRDTIVAASALPGSEIPYGSVANSGAFTSQQPIVQQGFDTTANPTPIAGFTPLETPTQNSSSHQPFMQSPFIHESNKGDSLIAGGAGLGGAALGAAGVGAYQHHKHENDAKNEEENAANAPEISRNSTNTFGASPATANAPSFPAVGGVVLTNGVEPTSSASTAPTSLGSTSHEVLPKDVTVSAEPTVSQSTTSPDFTQEPSQMDAHTTDTNGVSERPVREVVAGRTWSKMSVSELHVPGEFPPTPGL
jgi:hypothetical protein